MVGIKKYFEWLKQRNDKGDFNSSLVFHTPKDFDCENTIVLSECIGEDEAPTFYYIIDGLKGEKY